MGIVGFISSFLTRSSDRSVPLSSLVQLIMSASINHRSSSCALQVITNLAKAVPEWISVTRQGGLEMYTFSDSIKTFDVLSRLRELKRQQLIMDLCTN